MNCCHPYQSYLQYVNDLMTHLNLQSYNSLINTLGVFASVLLLYFIYQQGKNLKQQTSILENQNKHIQNESKITKSIIYISEFNSMEFQKAVITKLSDTLTDIIQEREKSGELDSPSQYKLEDVNALIDKDHEFYHAFNRLVSFFQELGNLYIRNIVDKDLINSTIGRYSIHWYGKFRPKIEVGRVGEKDETDWKKMNKYIGSYILDDFEERTRGLLGDKSLIEELKKSDLKS